MIHVRVSAVCRLRDGFTGRPIPLGASSCSLDGRRLRPVEKPGGYLILTDLPPGRHLLVLRAAGYQEERAELETGGAILETDVTLKPGAGYPLPPGSARLELRVTQKKSPAADRLVWLASSGGAELKLAQTWAAAGEDSFRLFRRGAAVPVQGDHLLCDGKNSEIVTLRELIGETASLAAPLARDHGRGCVLLPAQRYRTDGAGALRAAFRAPCTAEVYAPERGLLASLALAAGENQQTVSI